MPADVKFDAVSGDYYPIIYFNDYWNLQKDYYPINESLASLPLRVSFCPLSLWRWQLYAAQSTKSPWNFLGDELYEQSDEEQDSVKVTGDRGLSSTFPGSERGRGRGGGSLRTSGPSCLPSSTVSWAPSCGRPRLARGSCLRGSCGPSCHSLYVSLVGPSGSGPVFPSPPPPLPRPVPLTLSSDSMSLLPLTVSLNVSCSHLSSWPVSVTWRLSGASLGLSLVLSFQSSPQLSLHVFWSLCLSPHYCLSTPLASRL